MAITISGSGITSANIADGTIVNADVNDVAASKLTGALPAIDGSSLTGISAEDNSPIFQAFTTAGQTLPHATATVIQLNHKTFDPDSVFNTSTYRFTVPSGKAGKYLFQYGGKATVDNNNEYFDLYPKVNGVYSNSTTGPGTMTSYTNTHTNKKQDIISGTKIFDLSVGDYVELIMAVDNPGGNSVVTSYTTYLSGFRLLGS